MPSVANDYGFEPSNNPNPSSYFRRGVVDPALSLAKGIVSVPEAVVGVADIFTLGRAGKLAEAAGVKFKETRSILDAAMAPEQQQASRNVQQAQGFGGTLKAVLENPSTIAHAVIESAPSMFGGGAVAKGILGAGAKTASTAARLGAGAAGEGLIASGLTAEQVRQETPGGTLSPLQAAIAAGSGAATGLLNILGGKLANRLGVSDVEQLLAGAVNPSAKKAILRRVVDGAMSAGVEGLEELGQSAQEQAAHNVALGKPWDEGVAQAAVQGMFAGLAMGAGSSLYQGGSGDPPSFDPTVDAIARRGMRPENAQRYYGPVTPEAPPQMLGQNLSFVQVPGETVPGRVTQQEPPNANIEDVQQGIVPRILPGAELPASPPQVPEEAARVKEVEANATANEVKAARAAIDQAEELTAIPPDQAAALRSELKGLIRQTRARTIVEGLAQITADVVASRQQSTVTQVAENAVLPHKQNQSGSIPEPAPIPAQQDQKNLPPAVVVEPLPPVEPEPAAVAAPAELTTAKPATLKPEAPKVETAAKEPKAPRPKTDAQQFDDLVAEYGEQNGWGFDLSSDEMLRNDAKGNQSGQSVKGQLAEREKLKRAGKKAIFDLGGDGELISAKLKSEMLPKLRKFLARREAETTQPDTIDDLPDYKSSGPDDPFADAEIPLVDSSGKRRRRNFTEMEDDDLMGLYHTYRNAYSKKPSPTLDKYVELVGDELAYRAGLPEGVKWGTRGENVKQFSRANQSTDLPDLTLAAPESPAEAKVREDADADKRRAQKAKDDLAAQAAAPLRGTAGDLGQGDLLAPPSDLFAPPTPRQSVGTAVANPISEQEATKAVLRALGVSELPANIRFTNNETDPAGRVMMLSGFKPQIELNLRKIGSAKQLIDILREELLHPFQQDPEYSKLFDAIRQLVTDEDIQRQIAEKYGDLSEEEAVNEMTRRLADRNIFQRLIDWIVSNVRKRFGFDVSPKEAGIAAAQSLLREAMQNRASTQASGERQAKTAFGVEEEGKPFMRQGRNDFGTGTTFGRAERDDGLRYAKEKFAEVGLKVEQRNGDLLFIDAQEKNFDNEPALKRLIKAVEETVENASEIGDFGNIFIQSVREMMAEQIARDKAGESVMFTNRDTLNRLIQLSYSRFSDIARMLGMMARNSKDGEVIDVLQGSVNLPEAIKIEILEGYFAGMDPNLVRNIIDEIKRQIGGDVTDDEAVREAVENILTRVQPPDPGSIVYKLAQGRLKPKQKAKLTQLLSHAKVQEAVQSIIELAKANGVVEPKPKTVPLTPSEKLMAMVEPKTAAGIDTAVIEAVRQAERNAGKAAWIAETSPHEDEIVQYDSETQEEGAGDGIGPTPEQVEKGMNTPEFAHWRVIRDNLLGYSPVTDRLVQQVIQSEIIGTDFTDPTKPKKLDTREIDLNELARQPDAEVNRVFQAYLDKIEAGMDLIQASPTTKNRILAKIQDEIVKQLALNRAKKLNIFYDPVTRTAKTATGRLGELLNLGLADDKRYAGHPKVNRLIQKIASKFASSEDMDELARKSRSEKFNAVQEAVESALREADIPAGELQDYARRIAFNHIAKRLFEAETNIVNSVVNSQDVVFGPKTPKTNTELLEIRKQQIQDLHDAIEAGVADVGTMDSLARKRIMGRITPKLAELTKALTALPLEDQPAKAALFADAVLREMGPIDPANQDKVRGILEKAFTRKLEAAKQSVIEKFMRERITVTEKPSEFDQVRKLINSEFFNDSRLATPEFVTRVASKGAIKRLLPNIPDLIETVLSTPVKNQRELAQVFADEVSRQIGVPDEQADAAGKVFAEAYRAKFNLARESALKKAGESLSPEQKTVLFKNGKQLFNKISDFIRAGGMDDNEFFRQFAKEKWGDKRVPTDADIAKLKALVEREDKWRRLTPEEIAKAGGDPAKLAAAQEARLKVTEAERHLIQRQIEAMMKEWGAPTASFFSKERWTDPVLRRNSNAARNELNSANVLLGFGKLVRQTFDTVSMQPWYITHRAIANTWAGYRNMLADGKTPDTIEFFKNYGHDIGQVLKLRVATLRHSLAAFEQGVRGRGLPTHIEQLQSGMMMAERLNMRAEALVAKGDPASIVRSYLMRLWALQSLGHRQFAAIDVLQAKSAEWQEMMSQVISGLRERGLDNAQIKVQSDTIFGNITADLVTARNNAEAILTTPDHSPTKGELNLAAWELLQTTLYARIEAMGLNADEFEARNKAYTQTIAWNRPVQGPGKALYAGPAKSLQRFTEGFIPIPPLFGNAIGTALNRGLTFAGLGFFPDIFKSKNEQGETVYDPWYESEVDKLHRRAEAITGLTTIGILGSLTLLGVIVIRLGWPKDKKEREEWQAKGISPYTVEFPLGNGQALKIPLRIGPLAPMAGGLAGFSAIRTLLDSKAKEQTKLNEDAAKLGVEPGKASPIGAADVIGVAGKAALGMLTGGRTAAGMIGTFSDFGNPNVGRIVSGYLSPMVPLLPAYQELTRLAGVQVDPSTGSFWDLLVPSPWSGKRRVNMLGDDVATPGAVERILSIVTLGGGVTGGVAAENTAYANLYATGVRPSAVNRIKGYDFNGTLRPMTRDELASFARLRGSNLKEGLMSLGSVDGMSPTDAKTAVQGVIKEADQRALASLGVTVKDTTPRTASGTSRRGAFGRRTRSLRPSRSRGMASTRIKRFRAPSLLGGRSRRRAPTTARRRRLSPASNRSRMLV